VKKFFLFFILLILLALGIFLVGFIQLRLSPGQQAIIHTKTHGWHPYIVRHGEVTWMWQGLLPTNVTIVRFHDAPRNLILQEHIQLPSWEVYSEGLPSSAFDFSFTFALEYRFDESHYKEVFGHFFRPGSETSDEIALNTINLAHEQISLEIKRRASGVSEQLFQQISSQNHIPDSEVISIRQRFHDLFLESFTQIKGIRILSSGLTNIIIPDFDLYFQLRRNFLDNQQVISERLSEIQIQLASSERLDQAKFTILRSYGEILTQFPGLLDYFRIIGEVGVDPLSLVESLR